MNCVPNGTMHDHVRNSPPLFFGGEDELGESLAPDCGVWRTGNKDAGCGLVQGYGASSLNDRQSSFQAACFRPRNAMMSIKLFPSSVIGQASAIVRHRFRSVS
jgi:hypothetical protein